jgi:hypothetical protein
VVASGGADKEANCFRLSGLHAVFRGLESSGERLAAGFRGEIPFPGALSRPRRRVVRQSSDPRRRR